jgi:hypothetical protein
MSFLTVVMPFLTAAMVRRTLAVGGSVTLAAARWDQCFRGSDMISPGDVTSVECGHADWIFAFEI